MNISQASIGKIKGVLMDAALKGEASVNLARWVMNELDAATARDEPQAVSPSVPEGWKLVPIEPLDRQIGEVAISYPGTGLTQYARGIYQSMVLADLEQPNTGE